MKTKKFFDIRNYVPNYEKTHLNKVLVFNGGRNIGKTTSIWNEIEKNYMTYESRFVYIRNNSEKTKRARQDFNDRFRHRFKMTATHVYKLIEKEKGDGEKYYVNGDVVGFVCSITTYQNDKSGQFPNVKFIFHEEYNENTQERDIYFKWSNLLTTIIRDSDVVIVIVGNRDDVNNEFMVKWGVDIAESFEETSLQVISDNEGKPFIYFYELGNNDFKTLENDKTTFFKLSLYDHKSSNYINGNYTISKGRNVLNFHKHILPTSKLKHIYIINKQSYYFGTFLKDDEEVFFVSDEYIDTSNEIKKAPRYSLDAYGLLDGDNPELDNIDLKNIKDFFLGLFRENILYFTSFQIQSYFEIFTI